MTPDHDETMTFTGERKITVTHFRKEHDRDPEPNVWLRIETEGLHVSLTFPDAEARLLAAMLHDAGAKSLVP